MYPPLRELAQRRGSAMYLEGRELATLEGLLCRELATLLYPQHRELAMLGGWQPRHRELAMLREQGR